MIILRMRIYKRYKDVRGGELRSNASPLNWMEWEKKLNIIIVDITILRTCADVFDEYKAYLIWL